jgi:hypothetical protein
VRSALTHSKFKKSRMYTRKGSFPVHLPLTIVRLRLLLGFRQGNMDGYPHAAPGDTREV